VTEQQLLRMAKRRLAILRHAEEITGNVALTCRYYGISRQCFYKWRQRYDQHGLDGLRDRARRPRVCPNQAGTEVVGKIIYLHQHYHFGPAKIAHVPQALPRHPAPGPQPPPRLPALQAPGPALEALREAPAWLPRPDRRQVHRPAPRSELTPQALPVHRHRRLHPPARAAHLPQLNQKTAIQFADYVLERLPFRVEVIQTDNGASSSLSSTITCWTEASATTTSSPARRGSTARSNAPIASTPRSSTSCWTGW
jgi:hypothetical protein